MHLILTHTHFIFACDNNMHKCLIFTIRPQHIQYKHATHVSCRKVSDLAIDERNFPASVIVVRSGAEIQYFKSGKLCTWQEQTPK